MRYMRSVLGSELRGNSHKSFKTYHTNTHLYKYHHHLSASTRSCSQIFFFLINSKNDAIEINTVIDS